MRLTRSLVLGFSVGFTLSVASSCGPAPQPCGPSTCTGCCDENGECLAGTGLLACGVGGNTCAVCATNQACLGGACGLIDGGDYDGSFPDRPDSSINYDAGAYDAGPPDAGVPDAGRPDAGQPDAGMPMDAGQPDAGTMMDAGQSDAGMPMDAGQPDAGPPDSGTPVSYSAEIQPIFDTNCGMCHTWDHASTVNASTSCGGAGSVRIAPGNLNTSRLYQKIATTPPCGNSMPPGSPLQQSEIDLIRDWILQGAPNN